MKQTKGVTVVLYKLVNNQPVFAVFKRNLNWQGWELLKGEREEDESARGCAIREIKEEAGIDKIEVLQELNHTYYWICKESGEEIKRVYECFLAKIPEGQMIDISGNPLKEHLEAYFLDFKYAEKILTFDNQKEALRKAYKEIKGM
jgi:8-oxo-dGTP pyrophosphatase MutT (NUDIX family)